MATKKAEIEKVKGKHYDIAGISTIAILGSIAGRAICNAVKYLRTGEVR